MPTHAEHLVTTMHLNNGRIVQRIPSNLCHAYLAVDPDEVSWSTLGYLMREQGWQGPRSIYIKNIKGQQIGRGFEREVSR